MKFVKKYKIYLLLIRIEDFHRKTNEVFVQNNFLLVMYNLYNIYPVHLVRIYYPPQQ